VARPDLVVYSKTEQASLNLFGKILVFGAIAKIIDHKPIDCSSRHYVSIKNSMSTLKNLDISTKSWDPILCFLIRRKLDQQSLAVIENSADAPTKIPTLWSVLTFIERRACMLETVSAQPTATFCHQSVHNEGSCMICPLGHIILEHVAVSSKWTPRHGAKPLFAFPCDFKWSTVTVLSQTETQFVWLSRVTVA